MSSMWALKIGPQSTRAAGSHVAKTGLEFLSSYRRLRGQGLFKCLPSCLATWEGCGFP